MQMIPDGTGSLGLGIKDVSAYAIGDSYIIGKTEKGWFALDKQSRQVWYPHSSEEELKGVLGTDVSEFKLKTTVPWTTLVGLWPFIGVSVATGFIIIGIPIVRHKRKE